MAFVVATKRGGFEIRESLSTASGPRSKTLATFRELDDEVIEKARSRASKPLSAQEVRQAAKRVGVPGAREPVDRAARELIAELGKGNKPDPGLRRMLLDLLADSPKPRSAGDARHSIAEWMTSTPEERGRTLIDLLHLADALPHGGRLGKPLEFPPLKAERSSDAVTS